MRYVTGGEKMRVLIVGGGRTGAQLASLLLQQDHDVHIMESRKEVISRIHQELPTESIFEGEYLDPSALEQAGIKDMDVLAATTTSDDMNLVLCYIARKRYNIYRTIARVNNPRSAWLFDSKFNVDVAVNQAELLSRLIQEEMSLGDMMTLLKLRRGNYSLVEEKIQANAKGVGMEIKDLDIADHCVIAAIIRKGQMIVPRGVTAFEVGDEVLAVTDPQGAQLLSALLSPPESTNGKAKNGNGISNGH
jgi:trk system potassium uptake protein